MLTPRLGLRPNSPTATTSVSFNSPRSSRSLTRAESPASSIGEFSFFIRSDRPTWTSHECRSELATLGQLTSTTPRSRLDQAAGQQARLAERVAAVTVAHLRLFGVEVEGIPRPAGEDQAERFVVVGVERVALHGPVEFAEAGVDRVAEPGPPFEPRLRHVLAQEQIVDVDPIHLVHVEIVAGRIEVIRDRRPDPRSRPSPPCRSRCSPATAGASSRRAAWEPRAAAS